MRMRTNEENGVADEAIVIEWAVSSASCDFEVMKKRWDRALHSVKSCCFLCKHRHEGVGSFELAHLRRKPISAVWQLSGAVLSRRFFATLGVGKHSKMKLS